MVKNNLNFTEQELIGVANREECSSKEITDQPPGHAFNSTLKINQISGHSEYAPSVKGMIQLSSQNALKNESVMWAYEDHTLNPFKNTICEHTGAPSIFMDKPNFLLPGFGLPGKMCGHQRLSKFDSEFKAVKFELLNCKRIQCPRCYADWIKHRVFDMAVRLERAAYLRGERPLSAVFSVHPKRAKKTIKTFDQVNRNIFQRGYALSRNIGIDGGISIFHPFRIEDKIKDELREYRRKNPNKKYAGEVGFWMMARDNVLKKCSVYEYAKVGPHAHIVGFGSNPIGNTTKKLIIAIQGSGKPKRLETTADVVGKLVYLLTHAGVMNFKGHIINPTRNFGVMYEKSTRGLKLDDVPCDVATGINESVAQCLGMKWTADRGLEYPDDDDQSHEWLSIHLLPSIVLNSGLTYADIPKESKEFFQKVTNIIMDKGRPPMLDETAPEDEPGDVWDEVKDISYHCNDNKDNNKMILKHSNRLIIPRCIEIVHEMPHRTLDEIIKSNDKTWLRGRDNG